MFKLIASLSLVVSMSSFAAVLDVSNNTVAQALTRGECSLNVQNSPIIFGKGLTDIYVYQVRIWPKTVDEENVRQLDIGRSIKIKEIAHGLVMMDDVSINAVNVGGSPAHVTVEQVEVNSDGKLKMICVDDAPISF